VTSTPKSSKKKPCISQNPSPGGRGMGRGKMLILLIGSNKSIPA